MTSNTNPSYHISSLSITPDGWIVAASNNGSNPAGNDAGRPRVEITPSCEKLLEACRVDLEDELFTNDVETSGAMQTDSCSNLKNANNDGSKNDGTVISVQTFEEKSSNNNDDDATKIIALETLLYNPNLANMILKVISDVRRMGEPSSREKEKNSSQSGNNNNDGNNDSTNGGQRRNKRRDRGRGRVAQLEEQRRLRLQQEHLKQQQQQLQQQQSQSEQSSSGQTEQEHSELDAQANLPLDGFNNSSNTEENYDHDNVDDEGFILVGDSSHSEFPSETMPPDTCLAVTFNTLRVLLSLLRPILDNPHRKNTSLKMKRGPSIKASGKQQRNYLFSKHTYACVSVNCWEELRREYRKILSTMNEGLVAKMAKRDEVTGKYEESIKDWITSLFNHGQFTNEELERQCMNLDVPPNDQVSAILNKTLLDSFSYESGKQQDMLQRSIHNLQNKLQQAISRNFQGVRLTVYGSCLSGLALQGSHDVDVSVFIPQLYDLKRRFDDGIDSAEVYEKQMRRIVFRVRDSLKNFRQQCFEDLFAVTRARVPVIKGCDIYASNPYSPDGSLSFDLCFLNDIAVVNSSLLREYSLCDNRVRMLMLAVKSFAKQSNIASAANSTLSSYTWLNLVVFFLQCIGFVPNLQCPELMKQHQYHPDPSGNPWHCINGLDTFYVPTEVVMRLGIWKQPDRFENTRIPNLLYGFFNFYANVFPQQTTAVSIRFGKCILQKTSLHKSSKIWRLCIEDPFETFNSHCVHDLGCHLDEQGQVKVMTRLTQAADELGDLLQQVELDDGLIESFICLIGASSDNVEKNGQRNSKSTGRQGLKDPTNKHHVNTKAQPKKPIATAPQKNNQNQQPQRNNIKRHKGGKGKPSNNAHAKTQNSVGGKAHTIVVDIPEENDGLRHRPNNGNHRKNSSNKPNSTLVALEQARQKRTQPQGGNKDNHTKYPPKKPAQNPTKVNEDTSPSKPQQNSGNGKTNPGQKHVPKKKPANEGGNKGKAGQGNQSPNTKKNKSNKKHNHKMSRAQENNCD